MTIRNYIYIDEQAVNGLYNQLHNDISSITVSNIHGTANDINLNAGVNGGFIISGKGEYEHTRHSERKTEQTYTIPVERKTNSLIESLYGDSCEHIGEIIRINKPFDSQIFVGKDFFCLLDIFDTSSGDPIPRNEFKNLTGRHTKTTFSLASGNLDISSYFHSKHYQIMQKHYRYALETDYSAWMAMDGNKMRIAVRHMTERASLGEFFNFKIFGELVCNSDSSYTIKPFAVWR